MRGYLVTLEGIDGTGKSSVAAMLSQRLVRKGGSGPVFGREFVFTAEPTESDAGRLLRNRLQKQENATEKRGKNQEAISQMASLEDLFLFMADHADHLSTTVIPALERGWVVVSDRYSDSRVTYQGATLRDAVPSPLEWVRDIHKPWSVVPDLTLLFTIDPNLAVERCFSREKESEGQEKGKGSKGPEKFEQVDFLRAVSQNFLLLSEMEPERFVIIDASRSLEEVAKEALKAITDFLSLQG